MVGALFYSDNTLLVQGTRAWLPLQAPKHVLNCFQGKTLQHKGSTHVIPAFHEKNLVHEGKSETGSEIRPLYETHIHTDGLLLVAAMKWVACIHLCSSNFGKEQYRET
jgi:hypothetical protein